MELAFTEEQKRLREEVREFLEKELGLPSPNRQNTWIEGFSQEFSRKEEDHRRLYYSPFTVASAQ